MKRWLLVFLIILVVILAAAVIASGDGPQVVNVDQKISISADDITLGGLMRLWDQATGMRSTIPPSLASRKLTVHFSGLGENDALQKIFEGQPIGYILSQNRVLIGASAPITDAAPVESVSPSQFDDEPAAEEVPQDYQPELTPDVARQKAEPRPQQPTYVSTPFGLVERPSGNEPFIQLPPVQSPPPPPFFAPVMPVTPPAGAANGPTENILFGTLPIYNSPALPIPGTRIPPP